MRFRMVLLLAVLGGIGLTVIQQSFLMPRPPSVVESRTWTQLQQVPPFPRQPLPSHPSFARALQALRDQGFAVTLLRENAEGCAQWAVWKEGTGLTVIGGPCAF